MIKYWQFMQDYKYFLTESKVHFDSSERNQLHTELWKAWQKLRLFDTDKAMEFLLPFYSNTGRPAKNQPQILRSFILFFLLFSEGLDKPSLTLWVDRLWSAPASDLYARDKLLPVSWNTQKPDKPKGKKQKAQEATPKITEAIEKRLLDGKDIPFNFERRLQCFFYHAAVLPSIDSGLIPREHLTVSGDGTAVHTHSCPRGHRRDGMIRSVSLSLSTNWKNICRLFPSRICAWILQWTITPPTASLKTEEYGPSSI